MSEPIKFRHQYYKLAQNEFTTIRGKGQFKRRKVGDIVKIETPSGDFKAEVVKTALVVVKDISVGFLRADAEYRGFEIHSHDDFIKLLNSFRPPNWTQVTLDSELTVMTLRKVKE